MKKTMSNLKKSWKYTKGYRHNLFLYIFFGVLNTLCSILNPLLVAQLIIKITEKQVDELIHYAIYIALASAGSALFWVIGNYFNNRFRRGLLIKLQCMVAEETLLLQQKELTTNSSGLFADRINSDCNKIGTALLELSQTFIQILGSIGVLVAVLVVSKHIFFYFVLVMIIISICNYLKYRYYFKVDKQLRKLSEENTGVVTELIRGLKDIKVLNAIKSFTNKMHDRFTVVNEKRYELINTDNLVWLSVEFVSILSTLFFVVLSVVLIKNNLLTFPIFIVLYTYKDKIYYVVDYIGYTIQYLKDYNLSSERLFEIIDHEKFEKEKFGTVELPKVSGDFEFDNVSFKYEKKDVIKNMSFKINANETVAFVGKSGSGKTTVFNLITKLYEADKGVVKIDGHDIKTLTRNSIRDNMSLITQDPYIFNFSIKENLLLVKEDATDKEIKEACKNAQIHDYIMSLPEGYETKVGEGGVVLSGGQKQRLAIARAFLKKTEIILFDEATSALDNETQKSIQEAIRKMKGEYTILIIAHRLSTVIDSDRILLINEGKVEAEGTHKELLEKNETYRNLYEIELEK